MQSIVHPIKIFAGTASRYMGEEICKDLGVELGKMNVQHFADGEFEVSFEETVRGCEVYLVQSTFPSCDNLMELLLMIDAAKRASAHSVIAVIPYFGWARQDRKDKPRVSIAAKLVADLLSAAGVNRVITMDLHADQIQGFFDVPVDHLYASSVFIPYIQSLKLEDMVIATPDVGGAKRANSYAKYLNVPLVLCHKQRAKANVVESMTVIGDVKDKNVILIDDMGDTGSKTRMLGATLNLGAEYTLPVYRKLTFGLLNTTRIQGKYTWTDFRLSANVAPAKCFDAGVNMSAGTFGIGFGWLLNLHVPGYNFFVGMDRTLGKVSKQFVPLNSNASVNLGMNILF